MNVSPLANDIVDLCEAKGLLVETDVGLGPYLAPMVIRGFDADASQRDITIAVEPRNWNAALVQRMDPWAATYRERLSSLTEVDFVAIVVRHATVHLEAITTFAELTVFLEPLEPPKSQVIPAPDGTKPALPRATKVYENSVVSAEQRWVGDIVFCAMPFANEFNQVFFDLMIPAAAHAGFTVFRADQEDTLQAIDRRIWDGVRRASFVMADITGHNPNVMYEIGVAHAMDRPTLLLRSDTLTLGCNPSPALGGGAV